MVENVEHKKGATKQNGQVAADVVDLWSSGERTLRRKHDRVAHKAPSLLFSPL